MHRCYDLFLFGDSNKMYTFPMKTFAGINFQMMSETIGIIVQYLIPNEQSMLSTHHPHTQQLQMSKKQQSKPKPWKGQCDQLVLLKVAQCA